MEKDLSKRKRFQKFYNTLPDNLRSMDSNYDIVGYWDALGRPSEFDYNQPKGEDGFYHGFSRHPKTGQILKSRIHPTFQKAIDEDIKLGYDPYISPDNKIYTFNRNADVPKNFQRYTGQDYYNGENINMYQQNNNGVFEIPDKAYGGFLDKKPKRDKAKFKAIKKARKGKSEIQETEFQIEDQKTPMYEINKTPIYINPPQSVPEYPVFKPNPGISKPIKKALGGGVDKDPKNKSNIVYTSDNNYYNNQNIIDSKEYVSDYFPYGTKFDTVSVLFSNKNPEFDAYYDPENKNIAIKNNSVLNNRFGKNILTHEWTHAGDDLNFNYPTYLLTEGMRRSGANPNGRDPEYLSSLIAYNEAFNRKRFDAPPTKEEMANTRMMMDYSYKFDDLSDDQLRGLIQRFPYIIKPLRMNSIPAPKKLAFGGPLKFKNIVEKQKYYDSLVTKYGEGVNGRQHYLDLYNKKIPISKDPNSEFYNQNTTWKDLISDRNDIDNPYLLYSSLMDEGGEQDMAYFDYLSDYDGSLSFGLDTFGERVDDFIKAGYVDPDIKKRVSYKGFTNEKGEERVSADFQSLTDVISAKNAYFKEGKSIVKNNAKKLGLNLSKDAEDYFTIVSFNYGPNGVDSVMKSYKDKGLFEDEKFLKQYDIGEDWGQVHKNALRRIQAAKMLQNELTQTGPQADAANDEETINDMRYIKQKGWGGAGTGAASGALTGATLGATVGGPWGALVGGVVGAVGGGIYGHVNEEKQNEQQAEAERNARMYYGNSGPISNESQRRYSVARLFAYGGKLNSLQEYTGDTHSSPSGGVMVDQQGNPTATSNGQAVAQVEAGEVGWNNFVFSNRKELVAKDQKTYADRAKAIKKKYEKYGDGDPIAEKEFEKIMSSLAQEQEMVKQQLGIDQPQQAQMAIGGPLYFPQYSGFGSDRTYLPTTFRGGTDSGIRYRTGYTPLDNVRADAGIRYRTGYGMNEPQVTTPSYPDLVSGNQPYRFGNDFINDQIKDTKFSPFVGPTQDGRIYDEDFGYSRKDDRRVKGEIRKDIRNYKNQNTEEDMNIKKNWLGENAGIINMGGAAAIDFARYFLEKPRLLNANDYMINADLVAPIYSGNETKRDIEGQAGASRYLLAGASPTLRQAGNISIGNEAGRAIAQVSDATTMKNLEGQLAVAKLNKDIDMNNSRMRFMVDDWNEQSRAAHEGLLDSGIDKLAGMGNLIAMKNLYDQRITNSNYINRGKTDDISTQKKKDDTTVDGTQTVNTQTSQDGTSAAKSDLTNAQRSTVGQMQFIQPQQNQPNILTNRSVLGRTNGSYNYFNTGFPTPNSGAETYDFNPDYLNQDIDFGRPDSKIARMNPNYNSTNPSDYRKSNMPMVMQKFPTFDEYAGDVSGTKETAELVSEYNNKIVYPNVLRYADFYNVDRELLVKSLTAESAGDGRAISPAGAKGFGQFTDETAKEFNVDVNDIESSIDGAARYYKWLETTFNQQLGIDETDPALLAAGYNWGPKGVIENYNAIKNYIPFSKNDSKYEREYKIYKGLQEYAPTETWKHVDKVFGITRNPKYKKLEKRYGY